MSPGPNTTKNNVIINTPTTEHQASSVASSSGDSTTITWLSASPITSRSGDSFTPTEQTANAITSTSSNSASSTEATHSTLSISYETSVKQKSLTSQESSRANIKQSTISERSTSTSKEALTTMKALTTSKDSLSTKTAISSAQQGIYPIYLNDFVTYTARFLLLQVNGSECNRILHKVLLKDNGWFVHGKWCTMRGVIPVITVFYGKYPSVALDVPFRQTTTTCLRLSLKALGCGVLQ